MTVVEPVLRDIADVRSLGKVMGIQGIRDLVAEYVGEYRDIFRKEVVASRSIFEGAMTMWEKKHNLLAYRYMADESESNCHALCDVAMHFIDLYDVRYGDDYDNESGYDQASSQRRYEEHIVNLVRVFDDGGLTLEEMQHAEADYEEYMAETDW